MFSPSALPAFSEFRPQMMVVQLPRRAVLLGLNLEMPNLKLLVNI